MGFGVASTEEEGGEMGEFHATERAADERAGEEADHFVEESVANELEGEEGTAAGKGDGMEGADGGGGRLSAIGGEACEVVGAGEDGGACEEEGGVDETLDVPSAADFVGGKDGARKEAIAVDFATGLEAGMKVLGCAGGAEDADFWGEIGIEGGEPFGWGEEVGGDIGVGDLGEGVDAGVGAAGAVDDDASGGDFLESGFEMILDCGATGLALPATEGATVVGDDDFEAESGGHPRMAWESSQPWRMSWAATWSMTLRLLATLRPASWRARWAATEVRRSSQSWMVAGEAWRSWVAKAWTFSAAGP